MEYAVFDQDGKQMGVPEKAFPGQDGAAMFLVQLEQVASRRIEEGKTAKVNIESIFLDLDEQQKEELRWLIKQGEAAEATKYSIKRREVGQWQDV